VRANGTVRPSAKPMMVSRMTGPRLIVVGCFVFESREEAVLAGLRVDLVSHLSDAFIVVVEELVPTVLAGRSSFSAILL
jgi:hypothetical protein